jgi:hypothetical protein
LFCSWSRKLVAARFFFVYLALFLFRIQATGGPVRIFIVPGTGAAGAERLRSSTGISASRGFERAHIGSPPGSAARKIFHRFPQAMTHKYS